MVSTSTAPTLTSRPAQTSFPDSVSQRISREVHNLIEINQETLLERQMIRTIMDGGKNAVALLLGQRLSETQLELPVPNLMLSASNRLAYKLGKVPLLRVDPPAHVHSTRARSFSDKRGRIIRGWDEQNKLELLYPQIGRWLPGYAFVTAVLKTNKNLNGDPYPYLQLRDPYETYPGEWGADQQLQSVAYVRIVRPETLIQMFPNYSSVFKEMAAGTPMVPGSQTNPISVNHRTSQTGVGSWENQSGNGITLYEYYNREGVWYCIPERNLVLHHVPNILDSGPMFVSAKRFAFNKLNGQYSHIVGLLATIARINLNLVIAIEDSVHAETNIYGEHSGKYKRGRNQVNRFPPGTKVERPRSPIPFEAFQQASRLDDQLRIIANYPVQEDSVSPNSFVTGRGLEELRTSVAAEVQEYFTVLKDFQQTADFKRLEFADKLYPNRKLTIYGEESGAPYTETYTPATNINGNYYTRRVYGMMSGWDEPTKIITGLQLLQAGIIDIDTMRDNLDGIYNPQVVSERVDSDRAKGLLMEQVAMMGQQGDPRAFAVILEMMPAGPLKTRLEEIFAPPEEEDPAMDPMAQQAMAMDGLEGMGGPDSTQTILERLTSSGEPFAGVQTVRS